MAEFKKECYYICGPVNESVGQAFLSEEFYNLNRKRNKEIKRTKEIDWMVEKVAQDIFKFCFPIFGK